MLLKKEIVFLLQKAGMDREVLSIEACTRGGNNQTYRVNTSQGLFAIKKYFINEADQRNRLNNEFSFLEYAAKTASQYVPKAYYQDSQSLAIYEFIEGTSFFSNDEPIIISENDLQQAINFFCALNQPENKIKYFNSDSLIGSCDNNENGLRNSFPYASEACFSIYEHLQMITQRINILLAAVKNNESEQVIGFVKNFKENWHRKYQAILERAKQQNLDINITLEKEERCISPSDFGFHNALKRSDGSICFLDFEYAGWDDPAKMLGDFFSQLAVPIDEKYFDYFKKQILSLFPNQIKLSSRADLLRIVYQFKWCCIALNIFIPVNLKRRQFANPNLNVLEIKEKQLAKAQMQLTKIMAVNEDLYPVS